MQYMLKTRGSTNKDYLSNMYCSKNDYPTTKLINGTCTHGNL